jgi:hypothetical protein
LTKVACFRRKNNVSSINFEISVKTALFFKRKKGYNRTGEARLRRERVAPLAKLQNENESQNSIFKRVADFRPSTVAQGSRKIPPY